MIRARLGKLKHHKTGNLAIFWPLELLPVRKQKLTRLLNIHLCTNLLKKTVMRVLKKTLIKLDYDKLFFMSGITSFKLKIRCKLRVHVSRVPIVRPSITFFPALFLRLGALTVEEKSWCLICLKFPWRRKMKNGCLVGLVTSLSFGPTERWSWRTRGKKLRKIKEKERKREGKVAFSSFIFAFFLLLRFPSFFLSFRNQKRDFLQAHCLVFKQREVDHVFHTPSS